MSYQRSDIKWHILLFFSYLLWIQKLAKQAWSREGTRGKFKMSIERHFGLLWQVQQVWTLLRKSSDQLANQKMHTVPEASN